MDQLQPQLHLREVFQKIHNIKEGVASVRAVSRASGLRQYLSMVDRIAEVLRDALLDEIKTSGSAEEVEEIASRFDLAIFDLHRDAFELTTTELVQFYPNELLPAIAYEVSRFDLEASLILHPYSGNSYETTIYQSLFDWYQDFLAPVGANDLSEKESPWFVFFSYPKGEAQNVLLHLIMLSHEVMHLREIKRNLVDAILSDVHVTIETDAVQEAVSQIASSPIDRSDALLIPRTVGELYDPDYLQSVVVAESNAIIASWLREIVSDMLAARIYGPAYVAAFGSLSRGLGVLNSFSNSHPSSYFRIRFILGELQEMGYASASGQLSRYGDLMSYWENRLTTEEEEPVGPYHRIARRTILDSAEAIKKIVRADSAKDSLTVSRLSDGFEVLLQYLTNGIPPGQVLGASESFRRIPFSSIINAAWYFYMSEIETLASLLDISSEPSEPMPLEKLNQLVLKAFDASQLLEA